jgi:hypothetical protein
LSTISLVAQVEWRVMRTSAWATKEIVLNQAAVQVLTA